MYMASPDAIKQASSVSSVTSVTEFPLQALPPRMAELVEMWATALRVPHCMPGCAALAAVSACLGRGLVISHPIYGHTRGNIYVVVEVSSAGGKSASFQVFRPIQRLQGELIEAKNKRLDELETQKVLVETELSGVKRAILKAGFATDDQRERMNALHKQRRLLAAEMAQEVTILCEDTTTEKLALALSHNSEVMFSASADAGKAVEVLLGRYSRTGQPDDVLYDKAYSGDPCHVGRVSRRSVSLVSPCLSLFWFLQPIRVDRLFSEKILHEGGFLPRVMVCAADTKIMPPGHAVDKVLEIAWTQLLSDLFQRYHQHHGNPLVVNYTLQAREVLEAFAREIEQLRRGHLVDAEPFAARWSEWTWRLALDLHSGQHGATAHLKPLQSRTARGAVELARYFAAHQLRLLAKSRTEAAAEKEQAVFRFLSAGSRKHDGRAEVTARDVMLARIEVRSEAAKALLANMAKAGKLSCDSRVPPGGGHKTDYYHCPAPNDYQQKQS